VGGAFCTLPYLRMYLTMSVELVAKGSNGKHTLIEVEK